MMTQQILDNILADSTGQPSKRAQSAKDWLQSNGIPDRKSEAWKYTNPVKFMTGEMVAPAPIIPAVLEDLSPYKVYFKNGSPDLERSNLPEGATLLSDQSNFPTEVNNFANALNALRAKDGTTLEIASKAQIDSPIIIIHESDSAPLLTIKVGSLASVSILEAFSPDLENQSLCSPLTWLQLESGAHTQHIKTVVGGAEQVHIASTFANIGRDANLDSFIFAAGSKLMRQELVANINDSGAHVNAHGLFALRGSQHADQHVTLNHKAAHTTSDQLFKMVLDDASRGVFTGRLEIARDAQKVDASQLNKNLVLSKKAHVDTCPQLLVYADDVKCAHGATVGQLSAEEIFYLRSRGLTQSKAQKMLCHAFASDAVLRIKSAPLQTWVSNLLFENFEQFALEKFEQ